MTVKFSGMFDDEGFSSGAAVDLSRLEGTAMYCSPEAAEAIRKALAGVPLRAVHWIDSGDFHYVTKFFLERIGEPFELALFDHHSDRQESLLGGDLLSCGNWVLKALGEVPLLKRVHTCGTSDGSVPDRSLPVYLSLDLDILSREEFVTDWDQGDFTAERLKEALKDAVRGRRVLGMDICGGISVAGGAKAADLEKNLKFRKSVLEGYLPELIPVCGEDA